MWLESNRFSLQFKSNLHNNVNGHDANICFILMALWMGGGGCASETTSCICDNYMTCNVSLAGSIRIVFVGWNG